MHDGHADYTSIPVLVTVIESNDDHDDVHCEDFTSESDCGTSDECEWHADESACEDAEGDDHDDHDHDDHGHGDCGAFDHLNVDGLKLEKDGTVLYSQFQGLIEGDLDIPLNSTWDLSVHFLDSNGDEIVHDDDHPASCYPLAFSISDPNRISISLDDHDDAHDDDNDEHDYEHI